MQGEKSTEEQAMLERKISELQGQLQRKRDDHALLTSQTKQIQEEKRRLQKSFVEIGKEKENEHNKIKELELHAENAQRLINKLNDEKEVRLKTFLFIYTKNQNNFVVLFLRIYLLMNI
jgi:predicted  nucleic acid-binding Zn-ribbon protein